MAPAPISIDLPSSVSVAVTEAGMPRLRIATPTVEGEVYLQGAHITGWTPAGQRPVIWMSQDSLFQPQSPLRGGVPICFPWFGPGRDAKMSPPHGFARLANWSLVSAVDLDNDVTLTFRLTHADIPDLPAAADWAQEFELTYAVTFGAELTVVLTVRNTGTTDFSYEEALHTYFAVDDITQVHVDGPRRCPLPRQDSHGPRERSSAGGPRDLQQRNRPRLRLIDSNHHRRLNHEPQRPDREVWLVQHRRVEPVAGQGRGDERLRR